MVVGLSKQLMLKTPLKGRHKRGGKSREVMRFGENKNVAYVDYVRREREREKENV